MKKIIHTDYETFEETIQEFDDYHYDVAKEIRNFVKEKFDCSESSFSIDNKDCITDLYSTREANELFFGIIKDRKNKEVIAEKYKITIEKISDALL